MTTKPKEPKGDSQTPRPRVAALRRALRNEVSRAAFGSDAGNRALAEYDEVFSRACESHFGASERTTRIVSFGVGAASDFVASFGASRGFETFALAFETFDSPFEPSLVVATRSTVKAFVDAALGFDVATALADATLALDYSDATPPTALDRAAFASAAESLASSLPWRAESPSASPSFRALGGDFERGLRRLDDETLYWETRAFCVGSREFAWSLVFSARALASFGADDRIELRALAARGSMPTSQWRALKPGDVVYTEIPAERLFDVYIDGRLAFRGRPGLFRSEPAVELVERASSSDAEDE